MRNTALTWMAKARPAALLVVDDLTAIERQRARSGNGADCVTDPETEMITRADAARLENAMRPALALPGNAGAARSAGSGLPANRARDRGADRHRHVAAGACASAAGGTLRDNE